MKTPKNRSGAADSRVCGGGYTPPEIFMERIEIESGFAQSLTPSDGGQIDDLEDWENWDN